MNRDERVILLSSCRKDKGSYTTDGGQGVFSCFLTQWLNGPADHNGDSKITAAELHKYEKRNIETWCLKAGKTSQPQMLPQTAAYVVVVDSPRSPSRQYSLICQNNVTETMRCRRDHRNRASFFCRDDNDLFARGPDKLRVLGFAFSPQAPLAHQLLDVRM